jgi:hypothetical protein
LKKLCGGKKKKKDENGVADEKNLGIYMPKRKLGKQFWKELFILAQINGES